MKAHLFKVSSANVNTLVPHQESCAYARVSAACLLSKIELLESQFHSAGLDLIGVQEGRSNMSGLFNGLHYVRVVSPADSSGSYGVQLWLKIASKFNILQWKTISPRLMYVVCESQHVSIVCLVGHAPTESASDIVKDDFWIALWNTTRLLKATFPFHNTMLLGDMNARVGSVPSHCIGAEQQEIENQNGQLWRSFLQVFFISRRQFVLSCRAHMDFMP